MFELFIAETRVFKFWLIEFDIEFDSDELELEIWIKSPPHRVSSSAPCWSSLVVVSSEEVELDEDEVDAEEEELDDEYVGLFSVSDDFKWLTTTTVLFVEGSFISLICWFELLSIIRSGSSLEVFGVVCSEVNRRCWGGVFGVSDVDGEEFVFLRLRLDKLWAVALITGVDGDVVRDWWKVWFIGFGVELLWYFVP